MIVLRSHYTIDLVAGVIFANYFFLIAEKHCYLFDWYVLRIPSSKPKSPQEVMTCPSINEERQQDLTANR